jgi:hypothetical protein
MQDCFNSPPVNKHTRRGQLIARLTDGILSPFSEGEKGVGELGLKDKRE